MIDVDARSLARGSRRCYTHRVSSLFFRRVAALASVVLAVTACGDASSRPDAAPSDAGVHGDVPAVDLGDVPVPRCEGTGDGTLRVTIALDPDVAARSPEVWLAARCGDSATSQVVRWDGSATQVFGGMPPGVWRVFVSPQFSPGEWSSPVVLEPGATAVVPVTVTHDARLLGSVTAMTLPQDAGVTSSDGGVPGLPGAWRTRFPITDTATRRVLGEAEVETVSLRANSADGGVAGDLGAVANLLGGRIAVQLSVRSRCDAPPCPGIDLHSVELRTFVEGRPVDVVSEIFATGATLRVGEQVSLPRTLIARGLLPDGRYGLRLSVFGSVGQGNPGPRP